MRPFIGSLPETAPTIDRPIIAIQKYWLGPNLSAKPASGTVENTSTMTDTRPPITPA